MSVIANSHPTLMACVEAQPWFDFAAGEGTRHCLVQIDDACLEPPAGQIRLASDDAIAFAQSLFKAAAAKVPSTYFSTGGDEVNTNCYDKDSATQTALQAKNLTLEQALSNFVKSTHAALASVGKTPVVWEGATRVCISSALV